MFSDFDIQTQDFKSWEKNNERQYSKLLTPFQAVQGFFRYIQPHQNYFLKKKKGHQRTECRACYWLQNKHILLFSRSVVSDSSQPHGLQHARLLCPSLSPRACSNSWPSSQWCHPTISSSINLFSSCLQSFPAWGSFPMSQFFASGGQSIGVSALASVLPMTIQDWSPLGWTGFISLQSKELSRVFSNTTVKKHWFSGAQLPL